MKNAPGSNKAIRRIFLVGLGMAVFIITMYSPPAAANPAYELLIKNIFAYNAKTVKTSLADGSYRGEDGLLAMRPEVAQSLGLNTYLDQSYQKSEVLYDQAQQFFKQAVDAMSSDAKESKPGGHIADLWHDACLYKKTLQSADETLEKYREKLMANKDDRFNEAKCAALLERLLDAGLQKNDRNLRDALAYVYNKCQGVKPDGGYPLTPENVKFVNRIFASFVQNAPPALLQRFDLDRQEGQLHADDLPLLKETLGRTESRYLTLLAPFWQRHKDNRYAVEPLLFLALMKQESRFDPQAVSPVGAVGITQIMPRTAMLLGMDNIFVPPYLKEAKTLMLKERRLKSRALNLILAPQKKFTWEDARKARRWMQDALSCQRERVDLYNRYRRELLSAGKDERLNPRKAIKGGYRLFSELMQKQKGDISRALAAYNAGSYVVRKYDGVPPYAETVSFRNRVLKYYRDYLQRTGFLSKELSKGG